ncbi:hypothetical protein MMC17_004447 [Xylographa soralifera]|nr:hypothetical protein [Xylographa soralifera]
MAYTTQSLRDVDIRAVWDGVQEHPVNVDLCIRLECRPNTRFLILDQSHELVESASVAQIRHITPPVYEERCNVDEAPANGDVGDMFGPLGIDTFSPLDVEGLFKWNRELAATHQNQLAMLYRDITSLESFSPVVAAERWREIRESDVVPLAGTESDAIDGNETLRTDSSPISVEADGQPTSTQHSSLLTLSVRKRGQRIARPSCRRGAGAIGCPRRKRSVSLGSGELALEKSARTQRIATENSVETDQVSTCSGISLKPLRRTAIERARSRSDTHRHVLGICDWMCSDVSGITGTVAKAPIHTPNCQHRKEIGTAPNSKIDLFPEESEMQTRPPVPGHVISHPQDQRFEELDSTAFRTPGKWRAPDHAERSDTTVQSLVVHRTAPSWAKEDRKLYIVCKEATTPGTYEVDLKAKIRLSALDAQHHQLFCIPGLLRAEVAQERMSTGGFAFYFEPTVYTSDGLAMRFGSKTLVDYHIKESSHVIGRFRLDETPLISIRTKKPVHCISDFSASIEACAAILPRTDSVVRRLYYHAKLSCEIDEEDVWADEVEFFIVVRHGPSENAQYHSNNGTCATLHNTLLLSTGAKESEALISVLRNTEDMHNHLDVSFSIPIDASSSAKFFLPTLRPLFGKVLSESITFGLPWLPLKLEHIQKDSHTKWKVLHYSEAQYKMMRFDRLPIPDALPQVLEDNPQFKVSELGRVLFNSLTSPDKSQMDETPVSVARNLKVALFQILGGGLGCQIDVEVQIGKSSKVLTIDPQGWVPSMSYIDGRLASETRGEWREMDDTFLTLFNTRDMKVGEVVHVTFFFRQPCSTRVLEEDYVVIERDCNNEGAEQPLPRVVGMTILQAHMRLELENCTIVLSNPPESRATRFFRRRGHIEVRLPMLTSDYRFSFIRDTPQPTTPPDEVIKFEPSPMDKEEQTLVAIDTSVNEPDENEVRPENMPLPRPKVIGSEPKTTDTSFVMIDEASLGEESTKKTVELENSNELCADTIPWSSRSPGNKLAYCLLWYVFLPSCMLAHMYSTMGKIVTDNACIFFNDPCPLLRTQRELDTFRASRAESAKQSALNGHDSNIIYAGHNKLGDAGGLEKEDAQGQVLTSHVNGQVQREKDTGVLDWIDHALGWKG